MRPLVENAHAVDYVGAIHSAELEAEREFLWDFYTRGMGVAETLDFLARAKALRDAIRKEQEKRQQARRNSASAHIRSGRRR